MIAYLFVLGGGGRQTGVKNQMCVAEGTAGSDKEEATDPGAMI